jgi:hypothetical protein
MRCRASSCPKNQSFSALQGRVYVANGAPFLVENGQNVKIVPLTAPAALFATGFDFGSPPRGIVVDRNNTSPFYRPSCRTRRGSFSSKRT